MLAVTAENRPEDWVDEEGLTDVWIDRARKQLNKMKPSDARSLRRFRQVMSAGFRSIIGSPGAADGDLVATRMGMHRAGTCTVRTGVHRMAGAAATGSPSPNSARRTLPAARSWWSIPMARRH